MDLSQVEAMTLDEAAGSATVTGVEALPYNKYKIQIAKTMVKGAILACK